MLYQQPAAATKRLLGISRSSSSWPRSNRRAPPQQLATTFNLSMSPASRLNTTNNFHQVYANQVFSAGQLQQLQIQPKGVATSAAAKHAAAAGKMQTMQPVSLTIPIVAQSAIPKNNVGAAAHDAGAVYHQ